MSFRETQTKSNQENIQVKRRNKPNKPKRRRHKKHNYNIINFLKCMCINYKPISLLLACCGYLSYPNIYFGFISLIYTNYISYLVHLLSHITKIPILNKLHLYHHTHNTLVGYFTEFIFEIVFFLVIPIIIKHSFNITFINEDVLLFTFLIFITVHLVYYSYLHINNSHEIHHSQVHLLNLPNIKFNPKVSNFGPVYMDVLFGTNYKPYKPCENYDHVILNILLSFGCVILLKKYQNHPYISSVYKPIIVIFIIIYVLLYLMLPH